jgi:hypothetical protein
MQQIPTNMEINSTSVHSNHLLTDHPVPSDHETDSIPEVTKPSKSNSKDREQTVQKKPACCGGCSIM